MCSLKVCLIFVAAVIAVSCLSSTNAAVFTQPAAFHPAHRGKCFDKITRRAMLPNKEYKPKGICAVMTCDIHRQTINIETCPYVEMPGCEELPSDPNWAFPKCCAQFKCTDFKTGKEFIVSA
ncbi:uncharacterized protein LOC126763233 [Bactrocera neohumeralis]|uniref:uncharacterized protein LOC126763233 n=1 Tax=Bactrocera neohumeralis TaxID=98809 RepID=UPI0021652DD5|nr:uncharacterized protein LOC126763233 [Bactrocera neohumeralis]